uniref:Uncharacterized protein n=1 Tax=Vespula pensylvanica TaxID=30213 RepID=A0A834NGT2_VESPE|nr:hypothetical protein H0235_014549 [Vespula pensylvanica]
MRALGAKRRINFVAPCIGNTRQSNRSNLRRNLEAHDDEILLILLETAFDLYIRPSTFAMLPHWVPLPITQSSFATTPQTRFVNRLGGLHYIYLPISIAFYDIRKWEGLTSDFLRRVSLLFEGSRVNGERAIRRIVLERRYKSVFKIVWEEVDIARSKTIRLYLDERIDRKSDRRERKRTEENRIEQYRTGEDGKRTSLLEDKVFTSTGLRRVLNPNANRCLDAACLMNVSGPYGVNLCQGINYAIEFCVLPTRSSIRTWVPRILESSWVNPLKNVYIEKCSRVFEVLRVSSSEVHRVVKAVITKAKAFSDEKRKISERAPRERKLRNDPSRHEVDARQTPPPP